MGIRLYSKLMLALFGFYAVAAFAAGCPLAELKPGGVQEVVHILGPSGIGKKTLMRKLADPEGGRALRQALGLGDNIELFGPSFKRPSDQLVQGKAKQLVHQWQFANHPQLYAAKKAFPDAHHRVVVLKRDIDDHTRGLQARSPDWGDSNVIVRREWNRIAQIIEELKRDGFDVREFPVGNLGLFDQWKK